ncbi:MAG: flagellar hook-basal body complex protein FliE [Sporolactobacillus sp.]
MSSVSALQLGQIFKDQQQTGSAASASQSFSNVLNQAIGAVNDSQNNANVLVSELASGNSDVDLHNVMMAMQKADILLKTTVQVRDRVVSAYQQVMNMQV